MSTNKKQKVLLIGGPTASGKSALALKCAKLFNGEIISADCVQVYKHLNIGSAKASLEEMKQIKHYLIDELEPTENFNVSYFKNRASELITKLNNKNKLPIVVGGTGLYMKGLLFPYKLGNASGNEEVRKKYESLAKEKGKEYVYNLLKEIDPESAKKLHFNDIKRVIRSLEIFEVSGVKKSNQKIEKLKSEYDFTLIALIKDRKALYDKINKRVDIMFEMGLLEEVTFLIKELGLTKQHQSMCAIGYKEFFDYFEGNCTLEQVKENIKQNTRRYAKRQITWFKTMPQVKWFDVDNGHDKIIEYLKTVY